MKPFSRRWFAKSSALAAMPLGFSAARAQADSKPNPLPEMNIRKIQIRHTVMPCKVHLSEASYTHYDSIFLGLKSEET